MIKVSIIVPVYNVEPYLHRSLDSLVNQTLEDIEIICINDCSPDNSLDILKKYAESDERIRIIDLKKNQGVSVARNSGMEIAKGKYIGFCDPDDYVDLNFYEKLYNKAKESDADMIKSSLKQKKVEWTKEYSFLASIKKSKYHDALYHFCYIYKADLLRKNQINYPKDIMLSEDVFFFVKALFYSNKIEVVDEVFYHYIMREHGALTSHIGEVIINQYGTPLLFDFMNDKVQDKNEYKVFFNVFFANLIFWSFERIIPEYRKLFAKIIVNIYKKRRYSVVFENIPKFLTERDFESADILFEKLNDNIAILKYPEIKIDNLQNRKLYIWGAGTNGLDALIQCDNNGWRTEAFLDSKLQNKEFQGYKVLRPQSVLDSENRDFFIVISSRNYAGEIADICEKTGLKEGMNFWRPR